MFEHKVTEVGLATLRCLVNVYDVMLNEPDGLMEKLTMGMNIP